MGNVNIDILRTDTKTEAYKSLEKLNDTLSLVDADYYQWKWATIILHNCVQSFMVLTLEGTNQIDVVKHKDRYNDFINYITKCKMKGKCKSSEKCKHPQFELDYFINLYKKIKSSNKTQLFCTNIKFNPTDENNCAMNSLNDFRNNFIHFLPCSWSIIGGFPNMFKSVMEIVRFMVYDIGNFMYKFEEKDKVIMKKYILDINMKLEEMNYE